MMKIIIILAVIIVAVIIVAVIIVACNIVYHCMTTEDERNEFEDNN